MKTSHIFIAHFIIAAFAFLFNPTAIVAQINLRSISNFALFTTAGAVDNTGITQVQGNIGTNDGDISGFNSPSVVVGTFHDADATSGQAILDLADACAQINATVTTDATHLGVFGNGEIVLPGIYSMAAAVSIVDTLRLDAQGNSNAIFIFKVGGALTTAAGATVILLNGAKAENIYWKASGAISMAASTTMKGTMIADVGAASIGTGGHIEGRLLSSTGAVSTYQTEVYLPGMYTLPVSLLEFKAALDYPLINLRWKTSNEVSLEYYEIERSSDALKFSPVVRITAANTAAIKTHNWTDKSILNGKSFYRLKMVDKDAAFKYSRVISVNSNSRNGISVFPNPVENNGIQLRMYGQTKGEYIVNLFDPNGKKIKTSKIFHNGIDAVTTISLDRNLSYTFYYLEVNTAGRNIKTIKLLFK